jgi:hypothetical protein
VQHCALGGGGEWVQKLNGRTQLCLCYQWVDYFG